MWENAIVGGDSRRVPWSETLRWLYSTDTSNECIYLDTALRCNREGELIVLRVFFIYCYSVPLIYSVSVANILSSTLIWEV